MSYGDYEFVPGLSRPVGTSGAKPSERIIGQRRLGDDSEGEESISVQRNGYDIKRGIPNYVASSIPSLQNQPRNVAVMSRSWRNSEEEEYMWDDLGTKATDPGATAITKKEIWSDDLERVVRFPLFKC